MENKNKVFRLSGKVQHYQWGGFSYIPSLLGVDNGRQQPFAEYWLGAHPNAPAMVEDNGNLYQLLKDHPGYLGSSTRKAFGRLPYLLKILDVKDMLSIQVHPGKAAAELDFERENALGIPLNAPNRNYKDDNHKPELMMALGDFWLLHGFRQPEGIRQALIDLPGLDFLLPVFDKDNYKALYEKIMTMEQQQVNAVLQPLLDRIIPLYHQDELKKSHPDFWAARAALTFNEPGLIDRGIFSIYLFNLLHLRKGQAIFQDAGILHAYLEGQNVEIMANSDNVLRGGLTNKHIDVPELMKHVQFVPVIPHIIEGRPVSTTEVVFNTPAPDFELSRITLSPNQTTGLTVQGADIFIVLEGAVELASPHYRENCKRGEAFMAVSGAELQIKALSDTIIYRASIPAAE